MEDGEAERLDRLEKRQHRPLPCGRSSRGARLDLKVGEQVVGEHDQVLPRTVGRIHTVPTRAYAAVTSTLDLPLAHLWHFARGRGNHEKTIAQLKTGLALFIVAIVEVEEIELVVLRRAVLHVLPVDRHPDRSAPRGGGSPHDKARDARGGRRECTAGDRASDRTAPLMA
jgi:hypothetical protein